MNELSTVSASSVAINGRRCRKFTLQMEFEFLHLEVSTYMMLSCRTSPALDSSERSNALSILQRLDPSERHTARGRQKS